MSRFEVGILTRIAAKGDSGGGHCVGRWDLKISRKKCS